jgi:hypothetical protein
VKLLIRVTLMVLMVAFVADQQWIPAFLFYSFNVVVWYHDLNRHIPYGSS